jgi:hypothetical protein
LSDSANPASGNPASGNPASGESARANPAFPDAIWESDDCVRRMVVLPIMLAEHLADRAEKRGLSVSDLLVDYAEEGLRRDDEADTG